MNATRKEQIPSETASRASQLITQKAREILPLAKDLSLGLKEQKVGPSQFNSLDHSMKDMSVINSVAYSRIKKRYSKRLDAICKRFDRRTRKFVNNEMVVNFLAEEKKKNTQDKEFYNLLISHFENKRAKSIKHLAKPVNTIVASSEVLEQMAGDTTLVRDGKKLSRYFEKKLDKYARDLVMAKETLKSHPQRTKKLLKNVGNLRCILIILESEFEKGKHTQIVSQLDQLHALLNEDQAQGRVCKRLRSCRKTIADKKSPFAASLSNLTTRLKAQRNETRAKLMALWDQSFSEGVKKTLKSARLAHTQELSKEVAKPPKANKAK